jgi:hypothetical protein
MPDIRSSLSSAKLPWRSREPQPAPFEAPGRPPLLPESALSLWLQVAPAAAGGMVSSTWLDLFTAISRLELWLLIQCISGLILCYSYAWGTDGALCQDQLDIVDHETDGMELFNRDRQEFYVELLASVGCSSVKQIFHMQVLFSYLHYHNTYIFFYNSVVFLHMGHRIHVSKLLEISFSLKTAT